MNTIWQKILDELRQELKNGNFTVGQLFTTVKAVEERFKVSVVTARRVLQELSQEGLVRNVPHLGCVVQAPASPLPIYFVPADQIVQSAIQNAHLQKGLFCEAMLRGVDIQTIEYEKLLKLPTDQKAIVLFLNYANSLPTETMITMLPANIFPVCIGSYGRFSRYTRGIYILSDFVQMGQEMVKCLYDKGCRRIGYLGQTNGDCFFERFKGFITGMNAFKLPFHPGRLFNLVRDEKIDESSLLDWIADEHLDAIHTSGIEAYRIVKQILKKANITQIKEMTTIGFSKDDEKGVNLFYPDFEEMGRKAIQLALEFQSEGETDFSFSKSICVSHGVSINK